MHHTILAQQQLLLQVNLLERSPWYGHTTDYPAMLGGVQRNSSGQVTACQMLEPPQSVVQIVSARSARAVWQLRVDLTGLVAASGSGTALEAADPATLAWEAGLVRAASTANTPPCLTCPHVAVNAARSFGDVSTEAVFWDAGLMAGG